MAGIGVEYQHLCSRMIFIFPVFREGVYLSGDPGLGKLNPCIQGAGKIIRQDQ
jgi:hypothetical protein